MRRNERGISLIVLVIAIVLMAVLVAVGVVLLKNRNNNIRAEINLTDEEKSNLDYEELLEDIKATKSGKNPVNAEYKESRWVGDGYTITLFGGYDITDYKFYYGDKLIYTYTYTHPRAGEDGVRF